VKNEGVIEMEKEVEMKENKRENLINESLSHIKQSNITQRE
jgi:hypothetical protein